MRSVVVTATSAANSLAGFLSSADMSSVIPTIVGVSTAFGTWKALPALTAKIDADLLSMSKIKSIINPSLFTSLINPVTLTAAAVGGLAYAFGSFYSSAQKTAQAQSIINAGLKDGVFNISEYKKAIDGKSKADLEAANAALEHAIAENKKVEAFMRGEDSMAGMRQAGIDQGIALRKQRADEALAVIEANKAKIAELIKQEEDYKKRMAAMAVGGAEGANGKGKKDDPMQKVSAEIAAYQKLYGDRAALEQGYQSARNAQIDLESQQLLTQGMNEIAVKKWAEAQKLAVTQEYSKKQMQVYAQGAAFMASTMSSAFSDAATAMANMGKENKGFLIAAKAMAITEATINSYLAFTKALAAFPPPFNYAAAAATLAAGIAKVAAISSTPIKAETGLRDYVVPPGYERDSYPVMAQSGEQVTVTPKGENQSEEQTIIVYIDGRVLFQLINNGIKNGQVNINESNVGRRVYAK